MSLSVAAVSDRRTSRAGAISATVRDRRYNLKIASRISSIVTSFVSRAEPIFGVTTKRT